MATSDRGPDWVLTTLVMMTEEGRGPTGITVVVDGIMVSGKPIKASEYFDELAQSSKSGIGTEIRGMNQVRVKPPEEVLDYLHLEGARLWVPGIGVGMPVDGMYWRGRLADINGFFMGELVRAEKAAPAA